MKTRPLSFLSILLGVMLPVAASAQWALDGNPVCTASGAQDNIRIAANGLGGAVMVWQDNRGSSTDIYARQVGFLGPNEWAANGIPLCTASGGQLNPKVVHDGFGYMIYTWEDYRSGTADIYAAITDRLGNVFTPANGLAIATATGAQQYSALTSNQSLGVGYVAWTDTRSGNNDIYAQAFNVNNPGFWTSGGLAFCTNASDQVFPAIAPDGVDGAIVAWEDFRAGHYAIFAQRANLNNQLLWAANGVAVCGFSSSQISPMIVSDGAGGAIVAWQDGRAGSGKGAIYAQRINSSGVPQWTANGVAIATSTDLIISPKMISDGAGGAIVAWEDDRNISTTGPDIYAQRVNVSGTVLWAANGVPVCTAAFSEATVDIAPDGANGVVAAWQDLRALGTANVYAQRVNAAGSPVWTGNGIPVCLATGNQFNVSIAQSEAGASILAWEDRRTAAVADVYAQRIDTGTGLYGHPQPWITSIIDVPGDQGGAVRITFQPGDGDAPGSEYEIFDNDYHGSDVVGLVTNNGSASYTADVLTVGVGVANTYFVSANGTSNTVAGTSIDNLAPPAPTLTGQRNGLNVDLSWNSTAGDIATYTIQRADVGTLTSVATTTYTNTSVPQTQLRYRVSAVDIHGNVGPLSNELVLSSTVGVSDVADAPKVLTLLPNSPNPFRGSTAFRFGMPRAGRVRLDLYSAAGRRVRSRDLGLLDAGWRTVTVDADDDGGRPLAAGVYFCRIAVGGETRSSKVVIRR